jgi:DNA-binding CsgD family transcriptional regulator
MAVGTRIVHDDCVPSTLTAQRVASDVEVLARGGLDVATFLAEVDVSIGRAVPHVGACYATMDPATQLLTSTFKFGDLRGRDERDDEWGEIEYGSIEPTAFQVLARQPLPAAGSHVTTGGDVVVSRRMREYMLPYFGYADELRTVARTETHAWGGVALFRGADDHPFDANEISFMASLSPVLAAGLRMSILVEMGSSGVMGDHGGPAVVIVDAENQVRQISMGAERRLEQMVSGTTQTGALSTIWAIAARARAHAAGRVELPPRIRVRAADGTWLVLHGAPMASRSGVTGDVVITIEEARPVEVVPLVMAAIDLTRRERDVTRLVLQGLDTKAIAAALNLSAYTVQDHLKAVFGKAGVRSRRELLARLYGDPHTPGLVEDIAPLGWLPSPSRSPLG